MCVGVVMVLTGKCDQLLNGLHGKGSEIFHHSKVNSRCFRCNEYPLFYRSYSTNSPSGYTSMW